MEIESGVREHTRTAILNQEGGVKRVKLWRRVLRSFCFERQSRNAYVIVEHVDMFDYRDRGRLQPRLDRRQHARRSRRTHCLAAVLRPTRRVAGHRSAAFHAPLVRRHCGHAIGELAQNQKASRKYQNQSLCHNDLLTLRLLYAASQEFGFALVLFGRAATPLCISWTRVPTRLRRLVPRPPKRAARMNHSRRWS